MKVPPSSSSPRSWLWPLASSSACHSGKDPLSVARYLSDHDESVEGPACQQTFWILGLEQFWQL